MTLPLDALAELTALMARSLPDAPQVAALSDAHLTEAQRALSRVRSLVDQASAVAAAEIARRSMRELGMTGLAQRAGFNDPAKLVQSLTGSPLSEARRLVTVGQVLAEVPAIVTEVPLELVSGSWDAPLGVAVRQGTLTPARAEAIRTGLGLPASDAATADWRRSVLELIAEAVDFSSTVEELRRSASRRRAVLDAETAAALQRSRFEARSFRRFRRDDGMAQYTLLADPESAAVIDSVIDTALSPRLGGPRFIDAEERARAEHEEHDGRSLEQRGFDVFLAVFTTGVQADRGTVFAAAKPEVRVVVTAASLGAAARGAAGIAHLDGHADPISAASALRRICAGGYTTVSFDETGRALAVGRDQRLFTRAQRVALAVRDGGCLAPGCDRPPSQCEAHHIVPWSEGGGTDCDGGVLLCRFHHLQLHDSGSRIERDPGGGYRLRRGERGGPAGEQGETVALRSKSGAMAELRLRAGAW